MRCEAICSARPATPSPARPASAASSLWGSGDNGKSVFLQILYRLLGGGIYSGGYAETVSLDVLVEHERRQAQGPTPEIAKLAGARLVYVSETDDRRALNAALIKRLTGHGDPIPARHLFKPPFEYVPQFKLWMAGNRKPHIATSDRATWNRLRLIHFPVTIPRDQQDDQLAYKLIESEGSGILRWAVEGARLWHEHGLGLPKPVRDATEEYRVEEDLIARFLADCCEPDATPGDHRRAIRALPAVVRLGGRAARVQDPLRSPSR
jgi:putative DNA primase/helicase